MTNRQDFWRVGQVWNVKVLQVEGVPRTEGERKFGFSSGRSLLPSCISSLTDFRYNVLSKPLSKFCDTIVTPSRAERRRGVSPFNLSQRRRRMQRFFTPPFIRPLGIRNERGLRYVQNDVILLPDSVLTDSVLRGKRG